MGGLHLAAGRSLRAGKFEAFRPGTGMSLGISKAREIALVGCLICSSAGAGPFDLPVSGRRRGVPAGMPGLHARPASRCPGLCNVGRAPVKG